MRKNIPFMVLTVLCITVFAIVGSADNIGDGKTTVDTSGNWTGSLDGYTSAQLLARGNHTGTQDGATTITGSVTNALNLGNALASAFAKADGSVPFTDMITVSTNGIRFQINGSNYIAYAVNSVTNMGLNYTENNVTSNTVFLRDSD